MHPLTQALRLMSKVEQHEVIEGIAVRYAEEDNENAYIAGDIFQTVCEELEGHEVCDELCPVVNWKEARIMLDSMIVRHVPIHA